MKTVEVLVLNDQAKQEVAGVITWDGEKLSVDPQTTLMLNVLKDRLVIPVNLRRSPTDIIITARQDPERWLELLHYRTGTYVRFTKPRES